jgi:hypothetical protein
MSNDDPRRMTRREIRREYVRLNTPWLDRVFDSIKLFLFKTAILGLVILCVVLYSKAGK